MLLRNVVEIAEDGGGKNGKYESFSFMILFTVTPLVMEDLQGSFYFLFMGLIRQVPSSLGGQNGLSLLRMVRMVVGPRGIFVAPY